MTATDLSFAQRILAFIEETRDNPAFRDVHLGDGVYRRMSEKSIDLSSCFAGTPFVFQKPGEYDASYAVRIATEPGLRLWCVLLWMSTLSRKETPRTRYG